MNEFIIYESEVSSQTTVLYIITYIESSESTYTTKGLYIPQNI